MEEQLQKYRELNIKQQEDEIQRQEFKKKLQESIECSICC